MAGQPLRLIFMGTPDFSVAALRALLAAGHEVVAVYSQPPRKSGRGQKLTPTPVHAFAAELGLEVRTPVSLKNTDEQRAFAELNADAAVVVAYGLILPKVILDAPKLGCFNIHASLLPRWRGAAPIQRAIEAGDRQSGVTIMHMDEGLDTGDMVLVKAIDTSPDMNAQQLHDALSDMGARLIVQALAGVVDGTLSAQPQPEDGVTYAKKIDKAETRIDWHLSAEAISAQVRAFYPLAWFERDGQRVRVCSASVELGSGAPGEVLDGQLLVACGEGAVRLIDVQPAGKNVMSADAYVRGNPLRMDEVFI
ncbi:methionyl-tRNA formyltransferase [Magnetovibrio blakemorei]|uniref:Methionyl-tRNA formyltransferase n=1 Tax=Magnetovibrio blakemorei TaxID=28181 RepID=A0A1E5QB54_9PROT|nr:methionyl-tRNA formyltransferase [Magnetovibrio blakemorei]OEJ69262.1 methionyl-tRNA formyltransferase [Magnetovibrio blakemorei]